ncbi:MAG: efflux RND transporter periplasmic adaptor subunit [Ruminiclostridium sp.]|nr:efflux RND transporter periplasmic adaptor subunit [Ruminiclostridium sp.]
MKKFLIALLVIAAIGGLIYYNLSKDSDSVFTLGSSVRNAVAVKTMTIQTGNISSYVTAPGIVKEVNRSQVFYDTPLRILDITVDKNDPVKKGEKLIDLDTFSLSDEMERLQVQKEIQSITLQKLESGQGLLSLESSLASARKAVDQALDKQQSAQEEYEKQLGFYEAGIIPKTQLDQYENAVKDVKAGVETAQLNLESAEKAYQSSIGGQDLDIQAQIKSIELLSSQIKGIEKELSKIKSLEKAPISGVVTEINVMKGGYTMSGQPAFTIIDAEELQITASVNEYNTRDLAPGQPVKITGEALGDDKELSGEIKAVAPIATRVQGSSGLDTVVEVTITPKDGKELLKPGLNVDCDIITQEKNGVLLAEFNIFLDDKDRRQYVWLIDQETMTLKKRYVTLGIYSDMSVEILDGLKAGDIVVADPQPSMKDGDKIKIVE